MQTGTLRRLTGGMLILLLFLAACNGRTNTGPVLLNEQTIVPTVAVLPSVTPVPSETPVPVPVSPTPDFVAETAVALVTPTLPPSRTPTQTWTPSNTPTSTFTPSHTPPPTLTPLPSPTPFPTPLPPVQAPPIQPTAGIVNTPPGAAPGSVSAPPAAVDAGGSCAYAWFFTTQAPTTCPAGLSVPTQAAYLSFEGGYMIWLASSNAIYAIYNNEQYPRWERYPDTFQEGMPERDPTIIGPQGLWQQPRRGFGQLWRTNTNVRARLNWATAEWETAYTATFQQAGAEAGGTIYLSAPDGAVFALNGDQGGWQLIPQ
jgi:hypothetical protein